MPRRARLMLPNVSVHVLQRGNNRQACFRIEDDYLFYMQWLQEYAALERCHVHAYMLMANHVHLLLTPASIDGVGRMMKRLGQRYVQYINRSYRRSGTLWEGRYRSCLTRERQYVLACYRYIELNPVRTAMVVHPVKYRWSSYHANGQGAADRLVTPHPAYQALGRDAASRQYVYRQLFRHGQDPDQVDEIRRATNGNYVLGTKRFEIEVAARLGRRVSRGTAGRPKK